MFNFNRYSFYSRLSAVILITPLEKNTWYGHRDTVFSPRQRTCTAMWGDAAHFWLSWLPRITTCTLLFRFSTNGFCRFPRLKAELHGKVFWPSITTHGCPVCGIWFRSELVQNRLQAMSQQTSGITWTLFREIVRTDVHLTLMTSNCSVYIWFL
jgi:hypothetical protein